MTGFSYDLKGQLMKETPPVGVAIRYAYNVQGQVTQKINDTINDVLISYAYDAQGRLTGRSYLDGSSDSFTHDSLDRLATASNQNISYTFGYDSSNRLASQTDGSGNTVSYTYDAASRRTSLVVNGGAHTITYGYTANELTSITSSLAGSFGFGYDTLGRRSSLTYPNGITGTYSYNADQPTWLAGISYVGTGATVYAVNYPSFDKVGNRTGKNDGAAVGYGYDLVYRLLSSTDGETFTYDNAGNRLTDAARLYTVTAGNVMAAAGTTSYNYDSFGNTLTAGSWAYTWNSAGQLVQASNGTTTAAYAYDPFGRRISKTVNGTPTSYVYNGADIAASITGGAVTYFVHGPGVDEHLAMVQGSAPYFYHADGLGSVTAITDSSQNVVQSYSYTLFGQPTITTGFLQPYLFTGREYDPETGLNYHHARYLDMSTGRWLARDPLGMAAGDVVLTNYVGGNSVNFSDPDGLETTTYLYQKVDANGDHLKYGITNNPSTRYTKIELARGRLKILASGPRNEMLELERNIHKTLPIGPEERQCSYRNIQQRNGLKIKGLGLIGVFSQALGILDAQKRAEQFGVGIWTIMSYDLLGIPISANSLKPQPL